MICGDGRFTSMFDPETNGLSSWNANWSTPAAFEIITNGDIVFSDCGFYGGLFTGNLVYDQNARITWNNVGVCKNGGAPLNALVCGGLGYGTGGTNLSYQFGGYKSLIYNCYFNGATCDLRGQVSANGISFVFNHIAGGTGLASVIFDSSSAPNQVCNYNNVIGNIVEGTGFTNLCWLNAANDTVSTRSMDSMISAAGPRTCSMKRPTRLEIGI